MLTHRQAEAHRFIFEFIRRRGYSPSHDEVRIALGLRSKSGVTRLIDRLEERGAIRVWHHHSRAITVLRRPQGMNLKLFFKWDEEEQVLLPIRDVA